MAYYFQIFPTTFLYTVLKNNIKPKDDQYFLTRDFSAINISRFKEDLEDTDWSTIYECNFVQEAYTKLQYIICEKYKKGSLL